jgi:hypothetical protein
LVVTVIMDGVLVAPKAGTGSREHAGLLKILEPIEFSVLDVYNRAGWARVNGDGTFAISGQ